MKYCDEIFAMEQRQEEFFYRLGEGWTEIKSTVKSVLKMIPKSEVEG